MKIVQIYAQGDFVSVKDEIIKFAKDIDIDCIGFTDLKFRDEFKERLKYSIESGYSSGFEEQDINKRADAKRLLTSAESIIAVALPYRTRDQDKSRPYLSKASFGIDYHRVLMGKLKLLESFMRDNYGAESLCFCDIGPLSDREIAYKAGLGFYGKNCSIITESYGSFVFLGEIVTDLKIEKDEPLEDSCGNCRLCIDSCPAKALSAPYTVNAKRCISYITQKKEELTSDEELLLGGRIYGCDTCQDVCPKNKGKTISSIKEFLPEEWNFDPSCIIKDGISNSVFRETFGKTSSGWRGKKVFLRNYLNALKNTQK